MSSFIVSEETIDSIVSFLWNHKNDKHLAARELYNLMKEQPFKTEDAMANELLAMNYRATEQRYDIIGYGPKMIYKYFKTSPEQALKSMQCLSYQCYEGDVPNDMIYKFLDKAIEATKDYIIENLPAYKKAQKNILEKLEKLSMNSSIVPDEIIDSIITFLWEHKNHGDLRDYEIFRLMDEYPLEKEDEQVLANALLEMNYKAYNQRYGENKVSPGIRYTPIKTTPEQALVSMEYLRNQATEGDVPNSLPYKFLEEAIEATKDYIIGNLPAYEEAQWDIVDKEKALETAYKYGHRHKIKA